MNKLKYTPGPWVKDGIQLYGSNNEIVVMSDGPSFGSKSTWPDAEANSKLVIASPEMYEVLKEISAAFFEADGDYVAMHLRKETVEDMINLLNKIEQ